MARVKRIAHRGASGNYPENTRIAFEKAIEAGVDMIEFDCQLTSDGHVVVFHDEDLKRTAGVHGQLRNFTLQELKRLEVGSWRKAAYRGERILTLEEALGIMADRVDLCIDIKHFPDSREGIELKLLFILSHYDYLDRTILSSFDYRCLERVRELAPESRIGLIFGRETEEEPFVAARRLEASSIHVEKETATRVFFNQAWAQGLDVHVWTINEPREMEKLAAAGVQGLMSDYPERFAKLQRL
jgi:glycerophosphoryl diester phosphodiesterase